MTLEDFFTLTEMNNGLIAPTRVKELVAVMQKENDCVVKNISDVTRQWSAVSSAIAATENQDCLHLFIELDGLRYLNRWLKASGNVRNNTSDSFVEESITDILQALERLQVDHDKLISSGILMTVKDLLGHSSSKVQALAKTLFDNWDKEKEKEKDAVQLGVEKIGALADTGTSVTAEHVGSGSPESSNEYINASRGSVKIEKQVEAPTDDVPSIVSETLKAEEKIPGDASTKKEILHSTEPSSLSNPASENLHINGSCSESVALKETCSSASRKQGDLQKELHTPELDLTDDVKQMQKLGSSPKKVDKVEVPKSTVSTDDTDVSESLKEPGIKKNSNAIEKDCSSKASYSGGLITAVSGAKSRIDDDNSLSYCRSSMFFRRKEDGNCNSDMFHVSNTIEHKLETVKNSGAHFRMMENGVDKDNSDRSESGLPKNYDLPKPRMFRKDYAVDKKSDLDLDYGIIDALELARQVAIEVEREVEDCMEQSCSSSEKELSSKIRQPESPCSVSGKPFQTNHSLPVEVPTGQELSLNSPVRDVPANSAGNLEAEEINGAQDGESSKVTEAPQEVEANSGKGLSQFDLNQDGGSEDIEHQGDIKSPPISIVSASRAAAAPGKPVAPLQFEGTLGWKGSAATSAFRPASPRRVLENDAGLSANGSNSSSKQNRGFLDFDLNVAERGDDRITDLQSVKEIPVSSRLASGESSVGASPRRLERLELDLNQLGDDDGAPPDWRPQGDLFHQRNGHHSQSPCSSSSKQPSLRNIDLNDQPIFANDSAHNHYYSRSSHNLSSSGGIRSDDSVISIMGMRVEVNQKNPTARTFPLSSGRTPEPASDVNFLRSGGIFAMGSPAPYPHPPVCGYHGLAAGHAMPFSSPMYGPSGPIPYMVDSRGAPVVPQIMGGSSLAFPPAFPQPPFMFSITGTPSSNGVGPMRNNFDLNSGLILEGGGGFRQLFDPVPTRNIDEQFKSNSHASTSSGIGNGKRKEPDGGWEPYPFKPHSQPWR